MTMQQLTSIMFETSEQHKDISQAHQRRDSVNCSKLLSFIDWRSPFEVDTSFHNIVSRISGFEVKGSDMTFSIEWMDNKWPRSQENDLPNALTYELSNYPPALFEGKEKLQKALKTQLADAIWIFGIRKAAGIKLIQDSKAFREQAEVFRSKRATKDDIITDGEMAMVIVYTWNPSDSLNDPGDIVQFPIYSFHHDPKYWTDPEVFRPERFLPENKGNINKNTFMPFGIGPRYCIGKPFAIMAVKTVLAKLLLAFNVKLIPGQEEPVLSKNMFIMRPAGKLHLVRKGS
ncbi:hypothetical protein Pcinc_000773 [Petrolisthes cinctipes]|uniref:Cytochrome P450 n=1 Tax=Petrolisthes cinctipes TaxID=88211 RepID=A0AAE1GP49_PETCI|nr:hypothetical protein Pcinc_000773 [Petrolisthes cinctipes]